MTFSTKTCLKNGQLLLKNEKNRFRNCQCLGGGLLGRLTFSTFLLAIQRESISLQYFFSFIIIPYNNIIYTV